MKNESTLNNNQNKTPASPLSGLPTRDSAVLDEIPPSSAEILPIPLNSTLFQTQASDNQPTFRKTPPGIFAEKISPDQRSQLFEWLADHTYDEVVELVAAEPPTGFGIKVGKSTLCRFYKAHFHSIESIRHHHLENRAAEHLRIPDGQDYRAVLRDSYTQLLLERLWELLSRPVQSADELKKLTFVAEKMKSLDRDKEMLEEHREEELDKMISAFSSARAQSPSPESQEE